MVAQQSAETLAADDRSAHVLFLIIGFDQPIAEPLVAAFSMVMSEIGPDTFPQRFLEQAATQSLSLYRETAAFVLGQARAIARELSLQDTVLFDQLVDDLLLVAIEPAGDGDQKELPGGEAVHAGDGNRAPSGAAKAWPCCDCVLDEFLDSTAFVNLRGKTFRMGAQREDPEARNRSRADRRFDGTTDSFR